MSKRPIVCHELLSLHIQTKGILKHDDNDNNKTNSEDGKQDRFIICSLGELVKEEEVAMAMAHKLLSFANLIVNLKPKLNHLNEQCTTIKRPYKCMLKLLTLATCKCKKLFIKETR
jgi:hypothetical protein